MGTQKDGKNPNIKSWKNWHWVQPPSFAVEETETKKGELIQPRLYSQNGVPRLLVWPSIHYVQLQFPFTLSSILSYMQNKQKFWLKLIWYETTDFLRSVLICNIHGLKCVLICNIHGLKLCWSIIQKKKMFWEPDDSIRMLTQEDWKLLANPI